MRREISWSEEAFAELEDARERAEAHNPTRGYRLIEAVDAIISSLATFPLQGSLVETALPIEIRRTHLRAFGLLLYYTVYPSVDLQTSEVLDVIYFLACRHERQGEPLWSARDPFRL
ncbi:hypothetical protein IAD21_04317 [Abditibacteriota bacterium]|nr:hypothetical protein IAD21_04317 [Abditibacteriota bacterium]